jgi:hypothetical protein
MPWVAMMKFRAMVGWVMLIGWLLAADADGVGAERGARRVGRGVGARGRERGAEVGQDRARRRGESPGLDEAARLWLCDGRLVINSVVFGVPAISPSCTGSMPGRVALVNRRPAPKVGQREGPNAVAAVGRAEDREERLVLR